MIFSERSSCHLNVVCCKLTKYKGTRMTSEVYSAQLGWDKPSCLFLQQCFMLPQSLGVIGGKPNSAHYFIGYVGMSSFCLWKKYSAVHGTVMLTILTLLKPRKQSFVFPLQGRNSSTWTHTPLSWQWSPVKTARSLTSHTTVSTRPVACTSVNWTHPSQRYTSQGGVLSSTD